jgi:type II secretory pathway pseudopilin PulG
MHRIYQLGFTLFEIAFAVMILCLLATIMVIGQNFAFNSQVNLLEHDFRSIQSAIYDSQDALRSMHGDIHKVSLHLQDSAANGDNDKLNAILDGSWSSTSGHTFKIWQGIHAADLAQSSTDMKPNAYVLFNSSINGTGVSETFSASITELKRNYIICTDNIAGQFVKKLDLVMDDGNTAAGSMMVFDPMGGTAIATVSVVDGYAYMVCLGV